MIDEKKIFAKKLNHYMALHGKNQSDITVELGINKSTISTWCNGTKMPRMGTIQTLADYFGILKSDLIEEKPTIKEDDKLSAPKRELISFIEGLKDEQVVRVYHIVKNALELSKE